MYALELVGPSDAFACYEAAALADGVRRLAPGIALSTTLPRTPDRLAYTRVVSELVAHTSADITAARGALEAARIAGTGSAAVRANAIRGSPVDTQAAERFLGTVLVDRGYTIDLDDPDHELRVVFSGDVALLGWTLATPGDAFASRQPTKRPFFQPGSMAPRLARALVNITGAAPGDRLLDPMCGTGGILIEAGRMGIEPIGLDVQDHMVRGARRNATRYVNGTPVTLLRGDATRLPLSDQSVTAAVVDVPYGRQSHIAGSDGETLATEVVEEIGRVADRAVVVSDRSVAPLARRSGWTVRAHFARRVHRSLVRHIHHLERTG